jgi:hypothetical protein
MRCLAWLPAACVALATTAAFAQSAPDLMANRRRLLDQAFEAATRGSHSDALRLAEEAAQIQMSPSVRMFLAQQHEELSRSPEGGDHLVDAVTHAGACVREATEQVTLNRRVEILQACAEVFSRLNARVGRVRLQVPRPTPDGLRVRVNGRDVLERDWNDPVAVLPGEVTVDATTTDRGAFHRTLVLTASHIEPLAITFPVVDRSAPTASSGTLVTRIVGFTLLGVGVIGGAVGLVELAASSAQSEDALNGTSAQGTAWRLYYNDVNPRGRASVEEVCDRAAADAARNPDAAQANSLCESNRNARTLALAFGLGGAGLAVVGAALTVVSYVSAPSRSARVSVSPVLGANVSGASLRVEF